MQGHCASAEHPGILWRMSRRATQETFKTSSSHQNGAALNNHNNAPTPTPQRHGQVEEDASGHEDCAVRDVGGSGGRQVLRR